MLYERWIKQVHPTELFDYILIKTKSSSPVHFRPQVISFESLQSPAILHSSLEGATSAVKTKQK